MANYNITLDAKFNPFTYAEMLAPVAAATQAHQALEDAYSEMETKASVWENMANRQKDPTAYRMYKSYADELEAKADSLMRYGLTPSSRRGMMEMKSRFSKEILPIETAYKRREELAKEQRTAMAANPTLRYQRYADQMSLDDFIENPSIDYGKSYSGALLTQQVSQAVAAYQKAMTSEGGLESLGLPFQYRQKIQYGATPAQVMAAIARDAQAGKQEAVRFLTGVVDNVMKSSGVADWADDATYKELEAFANQGLYNAIGTATIQSYKDDYSASVALKREEARIAAEAAALNNLQHRGNIPINIDELGSPNQLGEKGAQNASKALSTLGIDQNGNITNRKQLTVIEGGYAVALTTKDGKGFKLWKNGALMSKQQFIDANKDNLSGNQELNTKRLKKWYETEVNKAYSDLGYEGKQVVYSKDVIQRNNNISKGKGAVTMSALRIDLGVDAGQVLQGIVELSRAGDETAIREIKSFNEAGELNTGKKVKVSDLLTDEGKLKGSTKPIFYAHPNMNTDAIIMKYRGKMYAIPRRFLGSIGVESYNMDVTSLQEAYQLKQQLIAQYGEEAYYRSPQGRMIESSIDNNGAAYVRAIVNAIGATYKVPDYSVKETSDDKM